MGMHVRSLPSSATRNGAKHDDDDGGKQKYDDHEDHEDHHHEQVKNSTDLRLPDVVAAPEPKPISLFWTALCEWDKARLPGSVAEKPRLQIVEDPPPVSRQLARSVVRLI